MYLCLTVCCTTSGIVLLHAATEVSSRFSFVRVYVFTKTYLVYLYFYLAPHLDIYRIMALRWWEGQELGLRLRLGGVDHARQTTVNIKSPHILRQCFKIFKIFIPIENSRIFIPIFRVFKYIYTEFICKDIFTIVVWALTRQLMNMPSLFIVQHLV